MCLVYFCVCELKSGKILDMSQILFCVFMFLTLIYFP